MTGPALRPAAQKAGHHVRSKPCRQAPGPVPVPCQRPLPGAAAQTPQDLRQRPKRGGGHVLAAAGRGPVSWPGWPARIRCARSSPATRSSGGSA